jgi:uncharacterized coiled-coil protein SlyX
VSETKPESPSLETRLRTVRRDMWSNAIAGGYSGSNESMIMVAELCEEAAQRIDFLETRNAHADECIHKRNVRLSEIAVQCDKEMARAESAEARIATLEQQLAATDQEAGR